MDVKKELFAVLDELPLAGDEKNAKQMSAYMRD